MLTVMATSAVSSRKSSPRSQATGLSDRPARPADPGGSCGLHRTIRGSDRNGEIDALDGPTIDGASSHHAPLPIANILVTGGRMRMYKLYHQGMVWGSMSIESNTRRIDGPDGYTETPGPIAM
jgi:hypothetical protein